MRPSVAFAVDEAGSNLRRTSLAVPQAEAGEVDPARILHCGDEVLAGRGLAVVPLEIEVGAGAEFLRAEDGVHHPDDLGALVVDGRRVEVRDLDIAFRADRVR